MMNNKVRYNNNKDIQFVDSRPIKELLERDFPPVSWIVKDLVPERAVVLLSAHPASFKTWFSLDMGIRVASGEKFLNHFNTEQAGVLILDSESGDRQLHHRLKVLGVDEQLPIFYKTYVTQKIDKGFTRGIAADCLDKNIKLVIFDSLTRFHDANENDSREMSKVFESFSILKQQGITSLIICHARKGSGYSRNDTNCGGRRGQAEAIRGSSDILAACDIHLAITPDENNHGRVKLTQTKNRFDEEMNPFLADFIKDSATSSHWEFYNALETKRDRANRLKTHINDYIIRNPGRSQKQLIDALQIANIGQVGEKRLREYVKELEADGLIYTKKGNRNTTLYYANTYTEEVRQNG